MSSTYVLMKLKAVKRPVACGKKASGPQSISTPLGGNYGSPFESITWIDATPALRTWFNSFLIGYWTHIYADASGLLMRNSVDWRNLSDAITTKLPSVRDLPSLEQIQFLDGLAQKHRLATTQVRLIDQLHYYTTRGRGSPANAQAYQASPWCKYHVLKRRRQKQIGLDLFTELYPRQPELQSALRRIVDEFRLAEIRRADSGLLGPVREARRCIQGLKEAMGKLSQDSARRARWEELSGDLTALSQLLQDQLREMPHESCRPSLREKRQQRLLRGRFLSFIGLPNSMQTGPKGLAVFIVRLLKERWPSIPAGLSLDPAEYFENHSRRDFIRRHLGLRSNKMNSPAKALRNILSEILQREALRTPLLRLARQAQRTPKGWTTFRSNLTRAFEFAARRPSKQEIVTDMMLRDWPDSRGAVTASLASWINELLNHAEKNFDSKPEGKTATEVMMRRAVKKLRSEAGLS